MSSFAVGICRRRILLRQAWLGVCEGFVLSLFGVKYFWVRACGAKSGDWTHWRSTLVQTFWCVPIDGVTSVSAITNQCQRMLLSQHPQYQKSTDRFVLTTLEKVVVQDGTMLRELSHKIILLIYSRRFCHGSLEMVWLIRWWLDWRRTGTWVPSMVPSGMFWWMPPSTWGGCYV